MGPTGLDVGGRATGDGHQVHLGFVDARADLAPTGEGRRQSRTNYFLGADTAAWRTAVTDYSKVRYAGVWAGVDVVFYANDAGRLEFDFIVAAGADAGAIQLRADGATPTLQPDGSVQLEAGGVTFALQAPSLYQEAGGERVPVEGQYAIAGDRIRIVVGPHDGRLPLIIDPTFLVLRYGSLLGGFGNEEARATAFGTGAYANRLYVTGYTRSSDFPTKGTCAATAAQLPKCSISSTAATPQDAFVAAFDTNATGTASLVWSTYLGATGSSNGAALCVDPTDGSVYVGGAVNSAGFPAVAAYKATWGGSGYDGFLAKINPQGDTILFSTYLYEGSGSSDQAVLSLDCDSTGVYIGGYSSGNYGAGVSAASMRPSGGGQDGWVAKMKADGSAMLWGTNLGGSSSDAVTGITVTSDGLGVYATAYADSNDMPVLGCPSVNAGYFAPGAPNSLACDPYASGNRMSYLAKFNNPTGPDMATNNPVVKLQWTSYIGGDANSVRGAVANPNFETYTTTPGPPDRWSMISGTTAVAEKDTTTFNTATNSVKITNGGSANAATCGPIVCGDGIEQSIQMQNDLPSSCNYQINVYFRNGSTATAQARFRIVNPGGTAAWTFALGTAGSGAWSSIGVAWHVTVTGTYKIQLLSYVSTTGAAFGAGDVVNFDTVQPMLACGAGSNIQAAVNCCNPTTSDRYQTQVRLDGSNNPIVGTFTNANDTTFKPATTAGAYRTTHTDLSADFALVKFRPDGTGTLYSTFMGAGNAERLGGLAVDAAGNAYVTGTITANSGAPYAWPTTADAWRKSSAGAPGGTASLPLGYTPQEEIMGVLDAAGATLLYGTYVGSSGNDRGQAIAVDGNGRVYQVGYTTPPGFGWSGTCSDFNNRGTAYMVNPPGMGCTNYLADPSFDDATWSGAGPPPGWTDISADPGIAIVKQTTTTPAPTIGPVSAPNSIKITTGSALTATEGIGQILNLGTSPAGSYSFGVYCRVYSASFTTFHMQIWDLTTNTAAADSAPNCFSYSTGACASNCFYSAAVTFNYNPAHSYQARLMLKAAPASGDTVWFDNSYVIASPTEDASIAAFAPLWVKIRSQLVPPGATMTSPAAVTACVNQPIQLSAYTVYGVPTSYAWTWPNPNSSPASPSSAASPTVTFSTAGAKTIGLTVTFNTVTPNNDPTSDSVVVNVVNAGNNSDGNPCNPVPPPTNLIAKPFGDPAFANAGPKKVRLDWDAPAGLGSCSSLTAYNVYRGGVQIGSATPPATTYTDATVTVPSTYSYEVTAACTNPIPSESAKSNTAAADVTLPNQPSAPTTAVLSGPLRIRLTWTDPGANDQNCATWEEGYVIRRSTDGVNYAVLASVLPIGVASWPRTLPAGTAPFAAPNPAAATTYDDAAIGSGSYYYKVSAVNCVGEGQPSLPSSVTLGPPSPPATVVAKPFGDPAYGVGPKVQIDWSAVTAVGSCSPLASYNVYRGAVQIGSVAVPTTTYVDSGVGLGNSYSYTVTAACTSPGNFESAPSAAATADVIVPTTPGAPSLSVISGPTLRVDWTASPGSPSNTNCNYMEGFRVSRQINGAGFFVVATIRPSAVPLWPRSVPSGATPFLAPIPAAATFFDDAPVTIGSTYDYKVSAVNCVGDSGFGQAATIVAAHTNLPPDVVDQDFTATPVDEWHFAQTQATYTIPADDLHGGDPYENNVPFTMTLLSNPTRGAVGGAPTLACNGPPSYACPFTYKPSRHAKGPDSFTFQVRDSLGAITATHVVRLLVRDLPDTPIAADDPSPPAASPCGATPAYRAYLGQTLHMPVVAGVGPQYQGLLANDVNLDSTDVMAVNVASVLPMPAAQGSVTVAADGSFDFTPVGGTPYSTSFRYQAKDLDDGLSSPYVTARICVVANQPPVAGFTATPNPATTGENVYFHDASYDPDGIVVSWEWDFGDGHTAVGRSPVHNFAAPGSYAVRLLVRDDGGASRAITVIVTVRVPAPPPTATEPPANPSGAPPTAFAGPDQEVLERTHVRLAGTAQGLGSEFTFSWRQTSGLPVVLRNATTATPSFDAPELPTLASAVLTFSLVVGDTSTTSAPDFVGVTVDTADHPPVASGGVDQSAVEGNRVTLDARGSSDLDGESLTYSWTQIAGPAVALDDPTSATPSFIAPPYGPDHRLQFKVQVFDHVTSSDGSVQVWNTPRVPPDASFTFEAAKLAPEMLTFHAVAGDGTATWDFGDGSAPATGAQPVHGFPAPGTYMVTLNRTSASGVSASTVQPVTVVGAPPAKSASTRAQEPAGGWSLLWVILAIAAALALAVAGIVMLRRRGRKRQPPAWALGSQP
jgi:PKD repeat protein